MVNAAVSRRVQSGGAFGYYDGWPTGTIDVFGTEYTASPVSGNNNTWKVSRELAPGTTVEILFGQLSADPSTLALPNLFDVNFTFSGSIEVYGVDVGGLTFTGDSITVEIAGQGRNYTRDTLENLTADLLDADVPPETAEAFVAAVEGALDAIDEVDTYAFSFFNSLTTADLSAVENFVNVDLTSGFASSTHDGTPVNIRNLVNATGSAFDDKIAGSAADNIINGGAGNDWISGRLGADQLFGGSGDDFIFFNADDTVVNGGEGRDLGYAVTNEAITADLAAMALEVLVGGGESDNIIMSGSDDLMVAGGGGSDTITAHYGDGEGLRIIWGGGGADQIVAMPAESAGPLGIMVATVAGLTTANFHLFDKAMLGLGGIDWSQINLLVLNPDAGDRIALGDVSHDLTVSTVTAPVTAWFSNEAGEDVEVILDYASFRGDVTIEPPSSHYAQVKHYAQTFLTGYDGTVFTNVETIVSATVVEYRTPWQTYIMSYDGGIGEDFAEDIGLGGSGWNNEIDIDYNLSAAKHVTAWQGDAEYSKRLHYFEHENDGPIDGPGNWFIVGGGLSGNVITGAGAIDANMTGITDSNVADWLLVA